MGAGRAESRRYPATERGLPHMGCEDHEEAGEWHGVDQLLQLRRICQVGVWRRVPKALSVINAMLKLMPTMSPAASAAVSRSINHGDSLGMWSLLMHGPNGLGRQAAVELRPMCD